MPDCYYLGPEDETIGPHSPLEVLRLHRSGRIEADSMIWVEGTADWIPLDEWLAKSAPRKTERVPLPAIVAEAAPVGDLSGLRLASPPRSSEPEPSRASLIHPDPRPAVEPPKPAPPPEPARATLQPGEVIAAQTRIPRSPLSVGYRAALAFCILMSLLVPLLYLGVAGSAGWWSVKQFREFPAWSKRNLVGAGPRTAIFLSVFHAAPALVVGVASVFMASLLFARRSERERPIVLGASSQPRLFMVIERLCTAVGAPMPERVELDCEPNASASLADGLRGLKEGKLRLRIGLPLVSGLNVREFTGVLAHEFGHFAQRNGMRLSVIARRLNARLAELAWSRTEWDDRLTMALGSEMGLAVAGAMVIKTGLGLARLFLKALVMLNHLVVCTLLRQMEFDADRAEIHLAGSESFTSAMRRITVLGTLFERYHLRAGLDAARPYDLPSYLMEEIGRLRPDEEQRIWDESNEESAKWWSTHPSNAARIAAATALAAPGVILSDALASDLFEHYDQLSRTVTVAHLESYESLWALERGALASM